MLSPRLLFIYVLVSILIYTFVGLLAWPDLKWLSVICGGLVVLRAYFLIRQLPQSAEE